MRFYHPFLLTGLVLPDERILFSHHLGELWIPPSKRAEHILSHASFNEACKWMRLCRVPLKTALQKGEQRFEMDVEKGELLENIHELQSVLQTGSLPPRYFFSPLVFGASLPLYSRRKLRIGFLESGFDLCLIDRNWDGLERIEDLTMRETLDEVEGGARVVSHSLSRYLNADIERWIKGIEETPRDAILSLVWIAQCDPDILRVRISMLAESWRKQARLPNYEFTYLPRCQEYVSGWLDAQRSFQRQEHELEKVGSYLAESMRAFWGGFYHDWTQGHGQGELKKKGAISLEFPFGDRSFPIEKVSQSFAKGSSFSIDLYVRVFEGLRKQARLQEHFGRILWKENLSRKKAALRVLCAFSDARVEAMLMRFLEIEQDPELLLRTLERLKHVQHQTLLPVLTRLVFHEHEDVSLRALFYLSVQAGNDLKDWFSSLLNDGRKPHLHPLLRHALVSLESASRAGHRFDGKGFFHDTSSTFFPHSSLVGNLLLTAEILEQFDPNVDPESVVNIFSAIEGLEEGETYRLALADPQRELRMSAVVLLSVSDHQKAKQWLHTRLMFESEPTIRSKIKRALFDDIL